MSAGSLARKASANSCDAFAFTMPRRLVAVMLACHALHADRTVYGDGLDLSSSAPAVPVGPNCRLCVRRDCVYREEDPIIDA